LGLYESGTWSVDGRLPSLTWNVPLVGVVDDGLAPAALPGVVVQAANTGTTRTAATNPVSHALRTVMLNTSPLSQAYTPVNPPQFIGVFLVRPPREACQADRVLIRLASEDDWPRIWPIWHRIAVAGDTIAWDPATSYEQARADWLGPSAGDVFV